jgi:hypothetical protein
VSLLALTFEEGRGGSPEPPLMGRHRGFVYFLQINLEPHHSLVKELFVTGEGDENPPNADESAD